MEDSIPILVSAIHPELTPVDSPINVKIVLYSPISKDVVLTSRIRKEA